MEHAIQRRLDELGHVLPRVATPKHSYVPSVRVHDLAYFSGKVPSPGFGAHGKLGADLDTATGYEAARSCALHALSQVEADLGLENIARVVKLNGYVACDPAFEDQPQVINGASDTLVEVLGDRGTHARTAVGVAALPGNWPVEIELVVQLKGTANGR